MMRHDLFDALKERYLFLVPYLLLLIALVVTLGIIRVEDTANGLERESIARANANCESVNEVRRQIVEFFNDLPPPATLEGGSTQAELDTYIQARFERDLAIRRMAFQAFEQEDCPPGPPEDGEPGGGGFLFRGGKD